MEAEFIYLLNLMPKFKSKSELEKKISIDCELLLLSEIYSRYSFTVFPSLSNKFYEAATCRKGKVRL